MVLEKHHVRRYTDNVSTYESEDNMAASSVTIRVDGEIKEGASPSTSALTYLRSHVRFTCK